MALTLGLSSGVTQPDMRGRIAKRAAISSPIRLSRHYLNIPPRMNRAATAPPELHPLVRFSGIDIQESNRHEHRTYCRRRR